MSYIYVISAGDERHKIGVTKHPSKRLKQLQTASAETLWLSWCERMASDSKIEGRASPARDLMGWIRRMTMTVPAALQIDFGGGFGTHSIRTQYLFENRASATAVFDQLKDACTTYHARSNEREKMVAFTHISGPATVDVSQIVTLGIDDPFNDKTRDALQAWETAVSELKASGVKAGRDIIDGPLIPV